MRLTGYICIFKPHPAKAGQHKTSWTVILQGLCLMLLWAFFFILLVFYFILWFLILCFYCVCVCAHARVHASYLFSLLFISCFFFNLPICFLIKNEKKKAWSWVGGVGREGLGGDRSWRGISWSKIPSKLFSIKKLKICACLPPVEARRGHWYSVTGVRGSCELPCVW